MQPGNEITFETHDAILVLDIRGDITTASGPALNQAYKEACDRNAKYILLKIEKSAYVNSGGIALLIQILVQTQKNDQVIAVTGVSDHFKKIFQLVGITKFATIYESLDEARKRMVQVS